MDSIERKQLRQTVERELADLEQPRQRREELVVEASADMLDQVGNAADRELASRELEIHSSRMRELRAALGRIEDGTYGTCIECESESA